MRAKSTNSNLERLALEGELTFKRAAQLKRALIEPLPSTGAFEIDLSKVTELDTAGVQLLLLVQRTAAAKGVDLRFVRPSSAVASVLGLLGLSSALGLTAPPSNAGGAA